MKKLHISVADKIATYLQRDGDIVCGNSDYQIVFTFDAEWKDTVKTARFRWSGGKRDVNIADDDTCTVPVINDAASVTVGVFADNLSTTPVVIPCKRSILCTSG